MSCQHSVWKSIGVIYIKSLSNQWQNWARSNENKLSDRRYSMTIWNHDTKDASSSFLFYMNRNKNLHFIFWSKTIIFILLAYQYWSRQKCTSFLLVDTNKSLNHFSLQLFENSENQCQDAGLKWHSICLNIFQLCFSIE